VDTRITTFGDLLRAWRQRRGCSQLALAVQADVSTRHLSWLETGKSAPSRAMVLHLCEQLNVPLRERNGALVAAGFAPLYRERTLDDTALAPARAALQRLLDAHEPYPALAVDRHWNLVAHNRMIPLLLQQADPTLLQPPLNVLRVSLHPRGLAPMIVNLGHWRAHVLQRLRRQIAATGDPVLQALHHELQAMPCEETPQPSEDHGPDDVAVPLRLRTPLGDLAFITTLTVFGTPNDVTLSELAVETLLPADTATAQALRAILESLPT
jgi:transcriptional regulator with XRE-family HTH domain